MKQSEQKNISSSCPKCGGYIDHYSMTCISCFENYDPNHPKNFGGMDSVKVKEADSKQDS